MATFGKFVSFTGRNVYRHYRKDAALCGTIRCVSPIAQCPWLVHKRPLSTVPDSDEPIKFSTSGAHEHRPFDTFYVKQSAPRYQSYSIMGSVTVFLVYFLVLREENDIDEELAESLYKRVPALREQDLLGRIKEAEIRGIDPTALKKELEEFRKSVSAK